MAAVMVLGMLPVTGTVMAAAGTTTYADPQTLTRPTDIYGDTTLNTGKVTVGKSVSTGDITVNGHKVELDGL